MLDLYDHEVSIVEPARLGEGLPDLREFTAIQNTRLFGMGQTRRLLPRLMAFHALPGLRRSSVRLH